MNKHFVWMAFVAVFCFLSSCTLREDRAAKDALEEIRAYFPYFMDNPELHFVNQTTKEKMMFTYTTWDSEEAEAYPYFSTNSGDWYARKSIKVSLPNGKRTGSISCNINGWSTGEVDIHFGVTLFPSDQEGYSGLWGPIIVPKNKNYIDYLTDTIMLPVREVFYGSRDSISPKAYYRIVKGKGLTDFSFDGKTVWRLDPYYN